MRITTFATIIMSILLCSCESQISLSIQKHIAHGELNDVIYYTGYSEKSNKDKIVLFIRGTGRFDASQDFGMGAEATLFGFSIVYLQKSYVEDEKKYYIHDNRKQRMHDIKTVIDDLIRQEVKTILLLADSEGTMLAPEIAVMYSNNICGLVCMGGSVFTFEEELLYAAVRKKNIFANMQDINLREKFSEIYLEPNNIEKAFLGHSYKFWSTYLRYPPIDDLKKLRCPILYVNGENDDFDIKKQQNIIQLMRKEGVNILQKVYPGIGHELKTIGRELSKDILEWGKNNRVIVNIK